MLQQRVENRRPTALQGAGIVLACALAALAGNALFSWMSRWLGTLASVGFILYGCIIAWLLMDRYALAYVYTANADCLRVCRAYGKRERFVADVWLNQVQGCGAPEEIKKRFPGARTAWATRPQCPLTPLALAYKTGGKIACDQHIGSTPVILMKCDLHPGVLSVWPIDPLHSIQHRDRLVY